MSGAASASPTRSSATAPASRPIRPDHAITDRTRSATPPIPIRSITTNISQRRRQCGGSGLGAGQQLRGGFQRPEHADREHGSSTIPARSPTSTPMSTNVGGSVRPVLQRDRQYLADHSLFDQLDRRDCSGILRGKIGIPERDGSVGQRVPSNRPIFSRPLSAFFRRARRGRGRPRMVAARCRGSAGISCRILPFERRIVLRL